MGQRTARGNYGSTARRHALWCSRGGRRRGDWLRWGRRGVGPTVGGLAAMRAAALGLGSRCRGFSAASGGGSGTARDAAAEALRMWRVAAASPRGTRRPLTAWGHGAVSTVSHTARRGGRAERSGCHYESTVGA